MDDNEENLKLYDKLDLESQIVCPWCGEGDFDRIGLKYHIQNSCEAFEQTKTIRVFWT